MLIFFSFLAFRSVVDCHVLISILYIQRYMFGFSFSFTYTIGLVLFAEHVGY